MAVSIRITKRHQVYMLYIPNQYNLCLYCCNRLWTTVFSCQTSHLSQSYFAGVSYLFVYMRFPNSVPYYKRLFALKADFRFDKWRKRSSCDFKYLFTSKHFRILLLTLFIIFFLQTRYFQKIEERREIYWLPLFLISCLYILQRLHSTGRLVLEASLGHRGVCPEASVHIEGFLLEDRFATKFPGLHFCKPDPTVM